MGAKLIGLVMALAAGPAIAAQTDGANGASGLPVPRFVSIKSERVNVRSGPTKTNDVPPAALTGTFPGWKMSS